MQKTFYPAGMQPCCRYQPTFAKLDLLYERAAFAAGPQLNRVHQGEPRLVINPQPVLSDGNEVKDVMLPPDGYGTAVHVGRDVPCRSVRRADQDEGIQMGGRTADRAVTIAIVCSSSNIDRVQTCANRPESTARLALP